MWVWVGSIIAVLLALTFFVLSAFYRGHPMRPARNKGDQQQGHPSTGGPE